MQPSNSELVGVRETRLGFEATVERQGHKLVLGHFDSLEEATSMHDVAAIKVALEAGQPLEQLRLNAAMAEEDWTPELLAQLQEQPWEDFLAVIRQPEQEQVEGVGAPASTSGAADTTAVAASTPFARTQQPPAGSPHNCGVQVKQEPGPAAVSLGAQLDFPADGSPKKQQPQQGPVALSSEGLPRLGAPSIPPAQGTHSESQAEGAEEEQQVPLQARSTEGHSVDWSKQARSVWVPNADGNGCCRVVTTSMADQGETCVPGFLLEYLGLKQGDAVAEGEAVAELVHPASGGRWLLGVRRDRSTGKSRHMVGLKPALRALGLRDGGVLVMRRPAQPPLAGALPEIELAVGVATPELQRKYQQRCRQAQQQAKNRHSLATHAAQQRLHQSAAEAAAGDVADDDESMEEGEEEEEAAQASQRPTRGSHALWTLSGPGQYSRVITGDTLRGRVTLPGFVLAGLELQECFTADLVHPATGGSWRVEAKAPGAETGSHHNHICTVYSGELKAALRMLGAEVGGRLTLRRAAQQPSAKPVGGSGAMPALQISVSPAAGPSSAAQRQPAVAAAAARSLHRGLGGASAQPSEQESEGEEEEGEAGEQGQGQPGRHTHRGYDCWRQVPGAAGRFRRTYQQNTHNKITIPGWVIASLGVGLQTRQVAITHCGKHWRVTVYRPPPQSTASTALQSGWKDVVKGTGLYTGCMLTLSRDPSAAIQPAVALEFEQPSSTGSGAQQAQHGSGQQAQRTAAAAAEAGPQRAQQGAMVARDLSDGPLGKRNSAATVNLREAGGVEAKRARPDGSSGPQAATMNTPAPPASLPAPPASLPAPPAWAAAPGLLPPAPEVPLDQFQMYRELKQAVAGCGVPERAQRTFIRLFLGYDRPTQQAHHCQVLSMAAAGEWEGVREWVEEVARSAAAAPAGGPP